MTPSKPTTSSSRIHVDGTTIVLDGLRIDDRSVAELLARLPENERPAMAGRALGIGARALASASVGIDLDAVDERVLRTVESATAAGEERVRAVMNDLERTIRTSFDPDTRTSAMARAIAEIDAVGASISEAVDPGRPEGAVATLVRSVTALLDAGFADLRATIAQERGRREAEEAGTRKGFDFEDDVEASLRDWAGGVGAVVERTSTECGAVGDDIVGDFVVSMPSGVSIVVEAKNVGRMTLNGATGILSELDRAMANRSADVAVCVSAGDAYPAEVGRLGWYDRRVLVVDDGEGTMLRVALRVAEMLATAAAARRSGVDTEAIAARIDRIRRMSTLFTSQRRALSDATSTITKVRDALDEMRRDLMAQLDEIDTDLSEPERPMRIVSSA